MHSSILRNQPETINLPKALAAQEAAARLRVFALGEEAARLSRECKRLEADRANAEKHLRLVNADLGEATSDLQKTKEKVAGLAGEYKTKKADGDADFAAREATLAQNILKLTKQEELLKGRVSAGEERASTLQHTLESCEETVRNNRKSVSLLEQAISDAKEELRTIENRITDSRAEISRQTALHAENAALETTNRELKSERAELSGAVDAANATLASMKAKTEKARAAMNVEREVHESKLVEERAALVQREGDTSIKESWLREKETELKRAKAELEKFYNRRISSVNF